METFKTLKQQIEEATKWKKGDGRPRGGSHIDDAHVIGDITEESSPSDAAIEFFKKKLKDRFSLKKMSSTINGDETWWNHKGTALQFKESIELEEATKWKKGDGRPRGGSHIENVKFWNLPDASLKYIQKDASDAMKANPEGKKAGKYADEVNDAATVLAWRKKNKIVVESADLDEGRNDTSKYTDDRLKAVLKQLKDLDQDAPSTQFMLKKIEKEMKKRGLTEELYNEEKKLKASDIVKILSNPEDWGDDGKDRVYTKGKNFVYIDSFYFTGDKALEALVKEWSKGGSYHQYFLDEYGCNLEIVDKFIEPKATGKHKRYTKDGVIGIELKIN